MKAKKGVVFFALLVACSTHGEYEYKGGPFHPTVTSTNMTIKLRTGWMVVPDVDDEIKNPWGTRRSEEYESLILTPNKRTLIFSQNAGYEFAPILFKNGLNGFNISNSPDKRSLMRGEICKDWYIALSNTPVEVGEDDVEMIMREGKAWVKFEEYRQKRDNLRKIWSEPPPTTLKVKPAEDKPPEPVPPTPVVAEHPPVATNEPPLITEDEKEGSTGFQPVSSQGRALCYSFLSILLIFCAAFCFVWRKTKR